jgi:hypothetical protein
MDGSLYAIPEEQRFKANAKRPGILPGPFLHLARFES